MSRRVAEPEGGLPGFRGTYQGSSFFDLLRIDHAHLLPQLGGAANAAGGAPSAAPTTALALPHATTVLAMKCAEGVLVAGDRLATEIWCGDDLGRDERGLRQIRFRVRNQEGSVLLDAGRAAIA